MDVGTRVVVSLDGAVRIIVFYVLEIICANSQIRKSDGDTDVTTCTW